MNNENNNELLKIVIEKYTVGTYGVRLFDKIKGIGDINNIVIVMDVTGSEPTEKEIALTSAISEILEKQIKELLMLYKEKIRS